MNIAHIVNVFDAPKTSDLHIAQPITFESMRVAKKYAAEKRISVSLYVTQFHDEVDIVPSGFLTAGVLERSILDVGNFAIKRNLPIISDILENLYKSSDADYFIYTNVDIALTPDFYITISEIVNSGFDAFSVIRRQIPDHYSSSSQLNEMYQDVGRPHGGYDCFVFRRDSMQGFILGNICIGVPYIGGAMLANLVANSKKFKIFRNQHLTFHIGEDRPYISSALNDYIDHNKNEYHKVVNLLYQRGRGEKLAKYFIAGNVQQKLLRAPFERRWSLKYQKQIEYLDCFSTKLARKVLSVERKIRTIKSTRDEKKNVRLSFASLKNRGELFVSCITFPNSGHRLLLNMLLKYFANDIKFSDIDKHSADYLCANIIQSKDLRYCDSEVHCDVLGCKSEHTNIQRINDINLQVPILSTVRYIIQYRHPIEALLLSYSDLYRYLHHQRPTFEEMFDQQLVVWEKYIAKWVLDCPKTSINTLPVNYHRLVKEPSVTIVKVLKFMRPDLDINYELISDVVENQYMQENVNVFESQFYNEEMFQEAEKRLSGMLVKLGVPLIYS